MTKKQKHPEKYNFFEEPDELIIGRRQKYMNISELLSFALCGVGG